jgi:hypothetical protein
MIYVAERILTSARELTIDDHLFGQARKGPVVAIRESPFDEYSVQSDTGERFNPIMVVQRVARVWTVLQVWTTRINDNFAQDAPGGYTPRYSGERYERSESSDGDSKMGFTWSDPREVAGNTEAHACAWHVCQPVFSDP